MSSNLDIPTLERPAFFDGQRLTAADLSDVQAFHRELRWLHNRSLHNWGIAIGYAVSGERGDREVAIQAGYALDCKGRELILSAETTMAIPAVAGASEGGEATYYLTVSYAEDEDLTAETRQGMCDTSGAVRRPEEPIIRWQDPTDRSSDSGYRRGLDIILATIEVENCQLASDVSGSERREAVPAAQPYIAAGRTESGNTRWELWPDETTPVAVATTVTTTNAGFGATPRYYAYVNGQRTFTYTPDNEPRQGVIEGYAQVAEAAAATFQLRVFLPQAFILSGSGRSSGVVLNPPQVLQPEFMARLKDSADLNWRVVWMGIEG